VGAAAITAGPGLCEKINIPLKIRHCQQDQGRGDGAGKAEVKDLECAALRPLPGHVIPGVGYFFLGRELAFN